jgi:hypothetical protein
MPKDPVYLHSGEFADDKVRVYPTARVLINEVDADRLLLEVHYYPTEDAYEAKKTESMRFLFSTYNAEIVADHL